MANRERLAIIVCLATCCAGSVVPCLAEDKSAATKRPARVDANGDPLPKGALFQLGSLRWHNPGGPAPVTFAADGKTLLSLNGEDPEAEQIAQVSSWDIASGRQVRKWKLRATGGIALPLRFSPDGRKVLGFAAAWDTVTGDQLVNLWDYDKEIVRVAFAPDGKTLVGLRTDWSIGHWDIDTKRRLQTTLVAMGPKIGRLSDRLRRHPQTHPYVDCVFSPDGKLLVAFSLANTVHLFDTVTGKELFQLAAHKDLVLRCAFSPDGHYLATAAPNQVARGPEAPVILWDTASGKEVRRLFPPRPDPDGPRRLVDDFFLAFSADGKFLAGWNGYWSEEPICLWELATGKVRQFRAFPEIPATLALSPDGKTLAASTETGTILVWDTGSGKLLNRLHGGTEYFLSYPRYAGGGRGLVAEVYPARGTKRLPPEIAWWDIATGKRTRTLPGREILGLSPDGGRMFVRDDDTLCPLALVDAFSGKVLRRSPALPSWSLFSRDGKRLALLGDVIRIVNVSDGKVIRRFTLAPADSDEGFDGTATISPDLRHILDLDGITGKARLRDLESGKTLWTAPVFEANRAVGAPSLSFCRDGRYAAVAHNEHAIVWDVVTGSKRLDLHNVSGRGFLADGRTYVFQHQGINLAAIESSRLVTRLDGAGTADIAESMTVISGGVSQQELAGGAQPRVPGKPGSRGTVRFTFSRGIPSSPDGKIVVTTSGKDIRLWEAATGKRLRRFQGRARAYNPIYAPDGKTLLAGAGPVVVVWDVTGLELAVRKDVLPVSAADFEHYWADLASDDGERFFRAFWQLAADPQETTVRIRKRLTPVSAPDPGRLKKLLADLDSDEFAVRESATRDLQREEAVPAMRKALASSPTLESRRRISKILAKIHSGPQGAPERLRSYRAVQLLEQIGTPAASRVLAELAKGARGAMLTREAESARERVELQRSKVSY